MRLLIDQNLAPEVAVLLRALHHEAIHTSELGKQQTTDGDLIAFATERRMIIVTRDFDFHEIVATKSLTAPSTILLRLSDLAPAASAQTISAICSRYSEQLVAGCLITANGRTIRVRSLPLTDD